MVATTSRAFASEFRAPAVGSLVAAVDGYLDRVGLIGSDQLRALQPVPFASVPFGAGGLALAFVRAARTGRDAEHRFAQARRWLRVGGPGWCARGALPDGGDEVDEAAASLYYGSDGLRLVRILLALGSDEPKVVSRLVGEFLHHSRAQADGPAELMLGVSGYLTALTLLERRLCARPARDTAARRSARAIAEVATGLAVHLLEEPRWQRDPRCDLSHGRAGVLHALLGWSLSVGATLPVWFPRALEQLADAVEASGHRGAPAERASSMERSFCHGAAGRALLWARAYERFGDARYLERARAEARFAATEAPDSPGNLCCGYAGRAYASLALDRIDAHGGWHPVALALAQRAVDELTRSPGRYPHGLLRGWPGVVCLVADLELAAAKRCGFPLVEG